jgi:hypothetical protein
LFVIVNRKRTGILFLPQLPPSADLFDPLFLSQS